MPDLLIRAIEDSLAARIKAYAIERGLTLNQSVVDLLERGLLPPTNTNEAGGPGSTSAHSTPGSLSAEMREVRMLGGSWSGDEAGAFRDAMKALERIK
jgi:hypothetical protein